MEHGHAAALRARWCRTSPRLIDVYTTYRRPIRTQIRRIAQEKLGLAVDFLPVTEMPPPGPKPFFSLLDQSLSEEISRQIRQPFWIDTVGRSRAGRDPYPARQQR